MISFWICHANEHENGREDVENQGVINNQVMDIRVQATTCQNAKTLIDSQHGKGCIQSGDVWTGRWMLSGAGY